jgi:hypothetical protein
MRTSGIIEVDMENVFPPTAKYLLVCEEKYSARKCERSASVFRHAGVPSGRDGG